jgi:hypothetical protein
MLQRGSKQLRLYKNKSTKHIHMQGLPDCGLEQTVWLNYNKLAEGVEWMRIPSPRPFEPVERIPLAVYNSSLIMHAVRQIWQYGNPNKANQQGLL